jgi:hypothetical protein
VTQAPVVISKFCAFKLVQIWSSNAPYLCVWTPTSCRKPYMRINFCNIRVGGLWCSKSMLKLPAIIAQRLCKRSKRGVRCSQKDATEEYCSDRYKDRTSNSSKPARPVCTVCRSKSKPRTLSIAGEPSSRASRV